MERKITKLEGCHTQVDVDVDAEMWKAAQEKSFKKFANELTVDGFRKGKAPLSVAKKHIDPMKVMDDAINSLLPAIYGEILEAEKLEPFAQPKVDVTKLSDSELSVKFVIVTAPVVNLGKYKDLKIGKKNAEVSEKELNEALDDLRKQNASLVIKEGAAEKGDIVVMDFVGKVDDKAFDGGTADNYELELGSNSFIPGFEDQLIGVKPGEHRDVNVTFPEQYTPELAGKPAVFGCDVHEVKTRKLPELNDEFVKELAMEGVENVEALKEAKKKELVDNKERDEKNRYLSELYKKVADDSKIEIPSEMIDDQTAQMKKDMEGRMAQSGLTLEQYLQFVGQKEEDFMAKLKEDAKRDITNYFILEEVGKAEKIEVSDADLEAEMAKLAEEYKMTLDDVKKALEPQKNDFRRNLLMTRIEQFLIDNNK